MPLIEVLLPFYGDVALLKKAVQSVIAQSVQDWRLTVVDDCYPDASVADWFSALDDPRVVYCRNEQNRGANENYRYALGLADADHVVVMGADDIMLHNYLQVVGDIIAERPGIAMIQPGVAVIDEFGRQATGLADRIKGYLLPSKQGRIELGGERLTSSLLLGNWTYFPSLCWNRAVIADVGFRQGLDVVQDLALILDVAARGGTMIVDPELAFLYRRHLGSDSSVRALDGTRFTEERRFFATAATENRDRGWHSASRSAQLHLTSRLHAAALIPASVAARRFDAVPGLLRHAAHATAESASARLNGGRSCTPGRARRQAARGTDPRP